MKNHSFLIRASLAGAMHWGPGSGSAFGRRGPLRAPDGDGNSAGAGGGESTANAATTANGTGAPGTAPGAGTGEKHLPQSQVNTLVANARREGREAALREQQTTTTQQTTTQQQQAPAKGAEQQQPSAMSRSDVQALMQRERAFTHATAAVAPTPQQLARMEAAFNAENPSDVTAWVTQYAADMGLGKPGNQTSQSQQAGAAGTGSAAAAPSTSQPGQGGALITSDGLTNIYAMTPEQFAATPATKLRELHEQNVAAANARNGAPPVPRPSAKR